MSDSDTDWLARSRAQEQCQRQELATAKAALLAALKAARVAVVTIDYDGEGDSGQMHGAAAHSAAGKLVKLRGKITLTLDGQAREYAALEEALDAFAWAVLSVYHAGFENCEGGYGTLTIDVRKSQVTLDHNDRIIDYSNTLTEV